MDVQIHPSRKAILHDEFTKPYFSVIKEQLLKDKKNNITIYPPWPFIFNAFNLTPFDELKVVILGQDPYHGPGQAHGLAFSVPDWVKQPPSLQNIFKEIHNDLWIPIPSSGNLERRARQWVFLLNAMLTVRAGNPASHQDIGWQQFTDAVIKMLSEKKTWLMFLLWWSFAQSKENLIDQTKHTILKAPHPSPFSVHKGFFGCKHFSKVNEMLRRQGEGEVER